MSFFFFLNSSAECVKKTVKKQPVIIIKDLLRTINSKGRSFFQLGSNQIIISKMLPGSSAPAALNQQKG